VELVRGSAMRVEVQVRAPYLLLAMGADYRNEPVVPQAFRGRRNRLSRLLLRERAAQRVLASRERQSPPSLAPWVLLEWEQKFEQIVVPMGLHYCSVVARLYRGVAMQ
jgi:hypothetical protein